MYEVIPQVWTYHWLGYTSTSYMSCVVTHHKLSNSYKCLRDILLVSPHKTYTFGLFTSYGCRFLVRWNNDVIINCVVVTNEVNLLSTLYIGLLVYMWTISWHGQGICWSFVQHAEYDKISQRYCIVYILSY